MNKKTILLSLVATTAIPMTTALAQPNEAIGAAREQMRAGIEAQKQEIQQIKQQNQTDKSLMKERVQAVKDTMTQKRLEFQASKEKMAQDKCTNIETKIATRINRYENNGEMFQTIYENMQARLTRLVERLKSAGADTTQLESDIATLNTKIEKLKSDQATFMTTLKDSQTFACGKSEGEFKAKIDGARQVPEVLKKDRQDIKDFFQTTIKADLQSIRQLLADQKAPENTH